MTDALRSASRTAAMVAAYRARSHARPDGLVYDPQATLLCGEVGFELAEKFDQSFPPMELWIELRTVYLDHIVRSVIADPSRHGSTGVGQVVVLGAGFDTRALRMREAGTRGPGALPDGVRFFEVDQPASQAEKRARLTELGGEYPAALVACDFETDDFLDRLIASGFQVQEPAVVIWEGVTPYLTEAAVRATLSRIASGCDPRTVVAFDYVEKRLAEAKGIDDRALRTRAVVEDVGEPVIFGVNDPLPLLYDCGFRHVETVHFDALALTLTGTYDRQRQFRFQHIAVASRTPPSWATGAGSHR
jgi:methyltransferase (TIGR00027 family)